MKLLRKYKECVRNKEKKKRGYKLHIKFHTNTVKNRIFEKATYNKEHLSLVLVWQQEKTEDSSVRNLVVKGFTVEVEESGIDTNVISEGRKREIRAVYGVNKCIAAEGAEH